MRKLIILALLLVIGAFAVHAQDAVELRITWYSDGNEGVVLRDLLDRFEADNSDIKVVIDEVAYADGILNSLPLQVEAGEAPDMARITDFARFKGYYLDLRPLVADAAYWEASFPEQVFQAMRSADDTDQIYGFTNQLTVTGPFINRTLFEQAGVDVPSDSMEAVSWEEWTAAATAVAEATGTPYAIAMDRTGHRFAGPAFSMGATYFNEDGSITMDTPGFRAMAEILIGWHTNGQTDPEVWIGSGGNYASAAPLFLNGQLVFLMSGSWQVSNFAANIGDAFDWEAVPNPTGPGGSTGMPGGAGVVGFAQTEHPAEVARVMDYLVSVEVYKEFAERTLFIPGHLGLGELSFQTDLVSAQRSLAVFTAEVPKFSDQAYQLQYGGLATAINNPVRDRLTQVLTGELTLDEAMVRIQEDVDAAVAAASGS